MADVQKPSFTEKKYNKSKKAKVFITYHWPKNPSGLTSKAEDKVTKVFENYLSQYTSK